MRQAGENTKTSGKNTFLRKIAVGKFSFVNKKNKATLLGLFLASIFFFNSSEFGTIKIASAMTCKSNADCQNTKAAEYDQTTPYCNPSNNVCTQYSGTLENQCIQSGGKYSAAFGCSCASPLKSNASGVCQTSEVLAASNSASPAADAHATVAGTAAQGQNTFVPEEDNIFTRAIKYVLIGILNVTGFLFAIAGTIFGWVVDPKNISGPTGMLNKQAVKDVWVMVRDMLNMTFILVLLFAAFCTIFQIDKWSLKKVWFAILINALLVNFSFPIARFFIDISNVMFYYFINNLFTSPGGGPASGENIFASFGAATNVANILVPENYAQYSIAYLIMMIIVLFIIGMTLLIIAALFIVRLVVLTMLVMFSPIGFVAYIFPKTESYADKWWKNLFSYSFFAPIMMFMMSIAIRITQATGNENLASFKAKAAANAAGADASWISQTAFLAIPIIILWAGIGVAKSSGIELADKVVSSVKKGGSWLAHYPTRVSGIEGAGKLWMENFKKKGWTGTQKIEERSAWLASKTPIPFRPKGALNDIQAKRVKDSADGMDVANMTEVDLRNKAKTGDQYAQAAALVELAGRGKAEYSDIDKIRGMYGKDSKVFNQLRNKVKTYDPVAAFGTGVDATGNVTFDADGMTRLKEHVNSNQFDAKKVNSSSLANAEFVGLALETGNMTPSDLADLSKKGGSYAKNIKKTLEIVANQVKKDAAGNIILDINGDQISKFGDMSNEIHRNIQIAFTTAHGKIHDSLQRDEQKIEIISRLDKDIAKKFSETEINKHANLIAVHTNSGKLKEIISNLGTKESKKAFVNAIMNFPGPPTKETLALQNVIFKDPYLSALV